ncbi:MAG: hypothetical protein AB7H43_01995 [Acidimicrobiia bacterium]
MDRRYRRPRAACQAPHVDLGGSWRAAAADEDLRRRFADPALDDGAWAELTVPGHWRRAAAFAGHDGPILHRRRFETHGAAPGGRDWLVLDGVFEQGDVWLDGAYLGPTEGSMARHTFEVTEPLRDRSEHVLAVEVSSPTSGGALGAYQRDDPGWNPGGIWRPVRLERTGPVRARSLRVLCRDVEPERALVVLRAELDSDEARLVTLRTAVGAHDEAVERPLAVGSNFVEWTATVARPRRWWPRALGEATLEAVRVEVEVDGRPSHVVERTIGLRSLSMSAGVLRVNGERLFLKGAVVGPVRLDPADATPGELAAVVDRAVGDGLDLLRQRGHVSRPELYDAADRAGLLLWQDHPLVGPLPRTARRQATRQAVAAVDLLGHHPSIALWCVHDLDLAPRPGPAPGDGEGGGGTRPGRDRGRGSGFVERVVARALERADGTRPVRLHVDDGADGRDIATLGRILPRAVRFRTGVGAPAAAQLRRLKYRPSGGFLLADRDDAATACAPLAVVADRLPARLAPGAALVLDVHVVNDRRQALTGAVVEARLDWSGGSHAWRWRGDAPADGCSRVGTIQVVVPDAPGPCSLALELTIGARSGTGGAGGVVAGWTDAALIG